MRGDIVLVPFPFTDLTRQKARPAVVVSTESFNTSSPDVILVAISSKLPAIPSDMELIIWHGSDEFRSTGLRVSSVIRAAKLVTLKQSLIYRTLGKLDDQTIDEVDERLTRAVGLGSLSAEIAARRAAETQVVALAAKIDHLKTTDMC
jgi:mRNA interferase MazF